MADSNNNLIALARAANKTIIEQKLQSQEVNCPTQALQEATKREELQVPVKTPGKNLEKQTGKPVIEVIIPPPQPTLEQTPPPPGPEPEQTSPIAEPPSGAPLETQLPPVPEIHPERLPSQELLGEFSSKIMKCIEDSILSPREKVAAANLFEKVKFEIQKEAVNWTKVNRLLKKSLIYGLRICPEIIHLAAIYYQAKVPLSPPKKKPRVNVMIRQLPQNQNPS